MEVKLKLVGRTFYNLGHISLVKDVEKTVDVSPLHPDQIERLNKYIKQGIIESDIFPICYSPCLSDYGIVPVNKNPNSSTPVSNGTNTGGQNTGNTQNGGTTNSGTQNTGNNNSGITNTGNQNTGGTNTSGTTNSGNSTVLNASNNVFMAWKEKDPSRANATMDDFLTYLANLKGKDGEDGKDVNIPDVNYVDIFKTAME